MEKLTDMEIFFFLASHLDNPCSIVVEGERHDIRYLYEEIARKFLLIMTNPFAIILLEKKLIGSWKKIG
ncbi:MAG: hypothetical protein WC297_02620 [Candidatus Paceibacterota bacterium]|jgi:hypothetical protein